MKYDDMNHSELVELVRPISHHFSRATPRKELINIVETGKYLPVSSNVNATRRRLYVMVDQLWDKVESLVACPLRTREPEACYACTDAQVAECYLFNEELIEESNE